MNKHAVECMHDSTQTALPSPGTETVNQLLTIRGSNYQLQKKIENVHPLQHTEIIR